MTVPVQVKQIQDKSCKAERETDSEGEQIEKTLIYSINEV